MASCKSPVSWRRMQSHCKMVIPNFWSCWNFITVYLWSHGCDNGYPNPGTAEKIAQCVAGLWILNIRVSLNSQCSRWPTKSHVTHVCVKSLFTSVEGASFEVQRFSCWFAGALLSSAQCPEVFSSLGSDVGEKLQDYSASFGQNKQIHKQIHRNYWENDSDCIQEVCDSCWAINVGTDNFVNHTVNHVTYLWPKVARLKQ